jgi:hypothetical protein
LGNQIFVSRKNSTVFKQFEYQYYYLTLISNNPDSNTSKVPHQRTYHLSTGSAPLWSTVFVYKAFSQIKLNTFAAGTHGALSGHQHAQRFASLFHKRTTLISITFKT